ncbi:hypothetical protein [Fervidobacterium nodosum]|uniref:Uncharacterized protein n=1 Tax=Fervidobacterium nodosum (strain ATCC 35602 / DSM 5306 / Rt17-B1) TaxID=381764 RepID=A7HNR5_FERNB|nr:hypothetical protein [Fervidobacterium nodosum]ABS61548.1 hypothetical protein Fnod_1713 [Fervidobacterium nodosum Rt17-B1]
MKGIKKIKKILWVLILILTLSLIFSCGLRIPQKAPEKVNVKYTKYLEFPITTYNLKIKDFISPLENNISGSLTLEKTDPLELSLATQVEYSPKTLLKDLENKLKDELAKLSENFNITIDTSSFANMLSGTIPLPTLSQSELEIPQSATEIYINSITFLNDENIPVSSGTNSFEIPVTTLQSLFNFTEANLKNVKIYVKISNITASNISMVLDGRTVALSNNQEISVSNLLVKKSSNLQLRFNSSTSGIAQVTFKFVDPLVNYAKDFDTSKLDSEKIEININETLFTFPQDYQIKLSGTINEEIVANISETISQNIKLKSGGTEIGSGNGTGKTASINLPGTNYFKLSDGINIEGTITLTGIVNFDFRTQNPKIKVTPLVNVTAVKDFPLELTVTIPNVDSIEFGAGIVSLSFNGLTPTAVSETFGGKPVSLENSKILVNLEDLNLPANVNILITGDVSANTVSYSSTISDDAYIHSASINPPNALNPIEITQDIPDFVKDLANSAVINLIANLNYNVSNITSEVKMNIESNFLTEGEGEHTLSGSGTISLKALNKNIDFTTFNQFYLKIIPTLSTPITVTNVPLKDGISLSITPEIKQFEISKINLKSTTFTQTFNNLYDFSNLFTGDFAFLKDFDITPNATVSFNVINSTINPQVTITILGNPVHLKKGEQKNISYILKNIIKNEQILSLSVEMNTGGGELSNDSEIVFSLDMDIPLKITATKDVKIKSENVNLSELGRLKDIIKSVKLKFGSFNNTTGIVGKLYLGKDQNNEPIVSVELKPGDNRNTVIDIPKEKLQALATSSTPWEIIVPEGETVSLNYNGVLSIAPYLAVELEVATSVSLKSN